MQIVIKLLGLLAIAYIALLAYMFVFQRKLLYFPEREIAAPENYGLSGFDDRFITSSDHTRLQLWYKPAAKGFPTIAYFHGNAANLANRANIFHFFSKAGFGVAALSYRGYGKSEGRPTEQGIYDDARATIAFLTMEKNIPLSQIMLYGESLGSGVAVHMASEYDVGALVLQAPYTSVAARAAEIYFFVPVKLMIQDRFDSLSKIGKVKAPLLLFHGERDSVIPLRQGRALFAASPSLKQAHFFPEVDHTQFDYTVVTPLMVEFARTHGLITP